MKYITFGEIMLRLRPPGFQRLFQTPVLEATFGGAEANVAVGLAGFGMDTAFVSVIPENAVGEACIRELRRSGIDTSFIVRRGERIGIYFLEPGNNQRPSKVIYDRAGSGISEVKPGDVDWRRIFKRSGWFHLSGITPALSEAAAVVSIDAVKTAREMGITVSCDLNFRKKLWKYGKSAPEVMTEIIHYVDIALGNEEDLQKSLGIAADVDVEAGKLDIDRYRALTDTVLQLYPGLKKLAVTMRTSHSANYNTWQAVLNNRGEFIVSRQYEIYDIVDRVGSGDAFSAGLLYGLGNLESDRESLEFAAAAGCLKHTIPGDFPLCSVQEVRSLASGSGSGRIQR